MNTHLVSIFSFGLATFLVGFMIIPYYIKMLDSLKFGKKIRENALIGKATEFFKLHQHKSGTPTMGGGAILGAVFVMVLISMVLQQFDIINNSLFDRKETYLSLFTLGTIGVLGAIDDYMNIRGIGKTKGLSGKFKMFWLTIFGGIGALWFYYNLGWNVDHLLHTPFGGLEIGVFFIPLFILMIVGFSNSVNISDGLDGLAGGLLLFAYTVYGFITFDQGLFLLSTLCFSIVGALIAFLWFNIKPAKFYMGDIGSLALGANLGIIAMLTNTIFVLFIVGAIFIFETLSVMIQITSKKLRNGKKVFIIAPFHHHLEAIGWKEETVVFRLWILGIISAICGVMFYLLQV